MNIDNTCTITSEKRKYARLNGGFKATIRTECLGEREIICENISQGGVFFKICFSKFEYPDLLFTCLKYEKISIKLKLTNDKEFEANCIVRWGKRLESMAQKIDKEYGIGIEFAENIPEQKNRIESYLSDNLSRVNEKKSPIKSIGQNRIDAFLEKRAHSRVIATLPVSIISNSNKLFNDKNYDSPGYIINISKGGAAILSKKPVKNGEYIVLKPKLHSDFTNADLLSEIVWSKPLSENGYFKIGVKFSKFSSDDLNFIENLITTKSVSLPIKGSRFSKTAQNILSEPVKYKNIFGKDIVGMYDHKQNINLERPFIIIPSAHGETKRNSIMLGYYLAQNDFNVLRYDNTNHLGESDGDIYFTTLDHTKEDILATLNYVQRQFGAEKIGVVVSSLTSRVALRVAAEDLRIKFLLCLVGVVNIQYTLKSVYQEDIIGILLENKDTQRTSFNILGFESDREYPMSAIRNNLHNLESTMKDLENIKVPVIGIAAEKDAWIDIDEVRKVFEKPSQYPRHLFVVSNALHHFYENLKIAKNIMRIIVSHAINYLCPNIDQTMEVESPNFNDVVFQNQVEKERLRKHELEKNEEKQFWGKYLNKYIIVEKSPDFREYLDLIAKFIPYTNKNNYILDAGCGPGHLGLWILRKLIENFSNHSYTYIGVDFVEQALQNARTNILELKETIKINTSIDIDTKTTHYHVLADLDTNIIADHHQERKTHSMCFKENTFDIICCSLLISYLKDPLGTLKEFFKLLKPGKNIIVSSLKPYADLSIAFKKMVSRMNSNEEIEEARILINSIGLIKQKEGEGHYQFYSGSELAEIVSMAGGKNLKFFRALTNQINVLVAQK